MADSDRTDRDLLARWSRRKAQARAGVELAPEEAPSQPVAAPEGEDPKAAAPLTDADMPPLESLDERSDYSGFLSPGVSEALRRKALVRLFRSPVFNTPDGLDDYAEDFTQFAPLGDLVTADMRHRLEQAARRLLADEAEAGPTVTAPSQDDAPASTGGDAGPESADASADPEAEGDAA